ncbi:MAG: hypothetical protein AAGD11_04085 [Planctomycetota bacterium]
MFALPQITHVSCLRALCVVLFAASAVSSRAEPSVDETVDIAQVERFAKLEAALTGATLVGHFTETGKAAINPKAERYELATVKHVGDGRWLFQARITYGENDVTVPLTLPVKWAGDTPVITVDNMGIPGLGFYTARVMIYADHYAGFWSGGDHGGHLFGVVERPQVNDE